MIIGISNYFHNKAKIKNIIIIFLLLVLFFISLPIIYHIFPFAAKLESLDALAFYTPKQIYSIMNSWGESGRKFQFWFHLIWDFAMPITGSIFLGLLISWLLQRSFKPKSLFQKLNLIALSSIFDLLENICIMIILFYYPKQLIIFAWVKTILTTIKYSFGIPLFIIIITGIVISTKNRFQKQ